MKSLLSILPGLVLSASLVIPASAQEGTEELIKRLKGQAGKTAPAAPGIKTRGIVTRGGSIPSAAPQVKAQTRSVVVRGMPAAVQVAAEEDKVQVQKTTAKPSTGAGESVVAPGQAAFEVKYDVDPTSKVARDNILFKKGSTEFLNEASFLVVEELAMALRSPALADLNFVIEGHASAEGSAYANQVLSQRRAERIVSVLAQLGANPSRLLPVGFGESQAQYPAHSEEFLLKRDRRVLIFRLDN